MWNYLNSVPDLLFGLYMGVGLTMFTLAAAHDILQLRSWRWAPYSLAADITALSATVFLIVQRGAS